MITLKQLTPTAEHRELRFEFKLRIGRWALETISDVCDRFVGFVFWYGGHSVWQWSFRKWCRCYEQECDTSCDEWPEVVGQ